MKEWILPYLKANKYRIALSLFIGVLAIGSGAMLLFVSGYLISKSALMPVNIMAVYVPIVSVRAFSIGRAVFTYLEKLISHDIALRILEKMRSKLYEIVEPKTLFLSSKYQTGELLGVLSDDIEHLQDLYLKTIFPSIIGLAIYTIIVIIYGSFHLLFAFIILILLGLIIFVIPYFALVLNKIRYKRQRNEKQKMYSHLTDAIMGMTDWKASGLEEDLIEELILTENEVDRVERKIKRSKHIRDGFIQLIIGLSIIAVLLWVHSQVEASIFSPTIIAAFVLMMFAIGDALLVIPEAIQAIPVYKGSLERIKEIEKEDLPSIYRSQSPEKNLRQPTIILEEVSYAYPGESNKIIKGLNLTIKPGEKIAILGRSGAGKSTLLKLLTGALKPTEGSIKLDKKEVNSNFLDHTIGVLNQKPHLFATSIANNLRIGQADARDEDIKAVADQAQLTDLINSLPEGFQTNMEEMGHRFSGGERQRVALARALLKNTPILLADEASIGLDPVTERRLMETIFSAAKDKTILWVTHHLTGVEQMDRILFIEDGEIKLDGSHDELMKSSNHYRKLYEMDKGIKV